MSAATASRAGLGLKLWSWFSLDWLVFLTIAGIWVTLYYLDRRRRVASRRRQSREFAEKLIAALPSSIHFTPKEASAIPGLNLEELRRITSDIERLGFVQAGDYRISVNDEKTERGFFRLFHHPEKHCFADTGAVGKSLASGDGAFLFGISSSLEEDWAIGTGNSKPSVIKYYWRLPKHLGVYKPKVSFEELFRIHCELRDRLAHDLQLNVIADASVGNHLARDQNTHRLRREALLNRDVVKEYREAKRIQDQGEWEWLGDYPEEAARRVRGKRLRPLMELSPTYRVPQEDALERMDRADENVSDEKPKE